MKGLVKFQRCRMVCDVGRRMVFGSEERRERRWRNREGIAREEPAQNVLMREKFEGENILKYIIFDTILAIVQFYV